MVDILQIDNENIHASGVLHNVCDVGVSVIACKKWKDYVLMGTQSNIGEWPKDATQTVIYDPKIVVEDHEDDCRCNQCKRGRRVSSQMKSCRYKLPPMGCLQIDSDVFDIRELVPRVCKILNIPQKGLCLWDADGNMNDMGAPTDNNVRFWNYIKKTMQMAMAELRLLFSMNGDIANNNMVDANGNLIIEEISGIYTQALNGWEVAEGEEDCAPEYNKANIIEWTSITEDGECAYDAETVEGEITLWGQPCPIPAGLDFATLLMDFIFPAVADYEEVVLWGLHVPKGSGYCFRRNVLCLTACKCDDCRIIQQDADLMEYFSRDYNGQSFMLPNGTPIVIKETSSVSQGAWLVPERIEGEDGERFSPYALFAQDATKFSMFGPEQNREYGMSEMQSMLDALSPDDAGITQMLIDSASTMWETHQVAPFCYELSVTQTYGALAKYRHLWFHFPDVCCQSAAKNCNALIDGDGNPIVRPAGK